MLYTQVKISHVLMDDTESASILAFYASYIAIIMKVGGKKLNILVGVARLAYMVNKNGLVTSTVSIQDICADSTLHVATNLMRLCRSIMEVSH